MFNSIKKLRQPEVFSPEFPWEAYGVKRRLADSPLLSVILPVYNQSHYIFRAVESILSQKGVRLEIVLVNDGSTDNLRQEIARLQESPQVKIYHKEKNEGLAEALNTGFDYCRGAFVTWTSADNIYLPGALSRMQCYLLANPAVGMVYGNMELIDDNDQLIPAKHFRPAEAVADSPRLDLPRNTDSLLAYPDNFVGACFLLRRAAWQAAGKHRSRFNGAEDYDFWLSVKIQWPIVRLPEKTPYYRYRLHGNSLTVNLGSSFIVQNTIDALCDYHVRQATSSDSAVPLSQTLKQQSPEDCDYVTIDIRDPLELFETKSSAQTMLLSQEDSLPKISFSSILRRSYCSDFQSVTNQEKGTKLLYIPLNHDDPLVSLHSLKCLSPKSGFRRTVVFIASTESEMLADSHHTQNCPVNLIDNLSISPIALSSEYLEESQELHKQVNDQRTTIAGAYQRALTFLISGVDALFFTVSDQLLASDPQLVLSAVYRRLILGAISRRPLVLTSKLFQRVQELAEGRQDQPPSPSAVIILLSPHILSASQASKLSGGDLAKFVSVGSYEQVLMRINRGTTHL
ncbi:MAG: glycosyltransferase family 2 protein [bacterium]|nr:glycosyltransferase family 2 protein [bacterium]